MIRKSTTPAATIIASPEAITGFRTMMLSEPQPRPMSGWTPAKIRQAERSAENGSIAAAADLSELILGDDYSGGLASTLGGVASLPLSFVPSQKRTSSPCADALIEDFWGFLDEDTIASVIGWLRVLGVAFMHVREWIRNDAGRLIPNLEVWHPRNFRYDWGTINPASKGWKLILSAGKEVPIIAGDSRWIIFTAFDMARPWSKAPWRSLSRLWLLKQYAISDWGFFSNKHGSGFIVAKNTSNGALSVTPEARKELAGDLQTLCRNGTVALPDGFDLALIESTARTWETFQGQIQCFNLGASIALTGNNLSSNVDQGSYAAASVHERVTQARIRSIAEALSTTLREQLLIWYAEINFGSRNEAPYPHWDTRSPTDQSARATVVSTIATALATLRSSGLTIPLDSLDAEFGLALTEYSPGSDVTKESTIIQNRALTQDEQYANLLADAGCEAGAESLAPHIDDLLAIIEHADSPKTLYSDLANYYADLDPKEYVEVVDRATVLASMRGRRAAVRDV
jgi:phage gp29-like protein